MEGYTPRPQPLPKGFSQLRQLWISRSLRALPSWNWLEATVPWKTHQLTAQNCLTGSYRDFLNACCWVAFCFFIALWNLSQPRFQSSIPSGWRSLAKIGFYFITASTVSADGWPLPEVRSPLSQWLTARPGATPVIWFVWRENRRLFDA